MPIAAPVSPSGLVAADTHGRLLVLDRNAAIVRRVPRAVGKVEGLSIAPDRRHAYVSVYVPDRPARLFLVDLADGAKRLVGHALSPAVSPGGRRLAYVASERRNDIAYRTALVVRNLRTGGRRILPLGPGVPVGTPPELTVSWSPDGRRVALHDGHVVRVVDTATARDVESQPSVPGHGLAPVFLDSRTLVELANCCIGRQRLVSVDLGTGARSPFAAISSPDETVQRLRAGVLVATTALKQLVVVSRGRVRVLANGVTAVAG